MQYTFTICRWLERSEFDELMEIAGYAGRKSGCSTFELDMEKILNKKYGPREVAELLDKHGALVDGDIYSFVDDFFRANKPTMEWDQQRAVFKLKLTKKVYWAVREFLKKHECRVNVGNGGNGGNGANGGNGGFVHVDVYPYYVNAVADHLRELGFDVEVPDVHGDKSLHSKPELKGISLRPYQEEAVEKWLENRGKGIIALPTGSGKSIIAIAALVKLSVRTLIVVYTKEQMIQWRDFILKYTSIPESDVGLFYGDEKKLAPITITTYHSGYRNMDVLAYPFDLLIVDEVHHLPADEFKNIAIRSLARYRLGLSATPVREDGRHRDLFPLMGGLIYYKTPRELVEQGYLAPFTIKTITVGLTEEEEDKYMELKQKYRSLVGYSKFEDVLEAARKGDEQAATALKIHSEMKKIVAFSESKVRKAIEIAREELGRGSKVIVFTQYVRQAEDIARELGAYLLTGKINKNRRKEILSEFKGAKAGVLVVTTVGDEGLDIPDANVGIYVSGTGSKRQFIQRLGRLLRPRENKQAVLYEIVVENTSEEYHASRRKNIEEALRELEEEVEEAEAGDDER